MQLTRWQSYKLMLSAHTYFKDLEKFERYEVEYNTTDLQSRKLWLAHMQSKLSKSLNKQFVSIVKSLGHKQYVDVELSNGEVLMIGGYGSRQEDRVVLKERKPLRTGGLSTA